MESITIKIAFLLILLQVVLSKAASLKKSERAGRHQGMHVINRPYFIAHGCERTVLSIACEKGEKIRLAHATYGRQNMHYCMEDQLQEDIGFQAKNHHTCTAPVRRTTRIVADFCSGEERCVVPVVNYLFGDPCPTLYKYLEIYYTCVES